MAMQALQLLIYLYNTMNAEWKVEQNESQSIVLIKTTQERGEIVANGKFPSWQREGSQILHLVS